MGSTAWVEDHIVVGSHRHRFELSKVLPTDVAEEDRVGDSGAVAAPAVKEEDSPTEQVMPLTSLPAVHARFQQRRSAPSTRHCQLRSRLLYYGQATVLGVHHDSFTSSTTPVQSSHAYAATANKQPKSSPQRPHRRSRAFRADEVRSMTGASSHQQQLLTHCLN